MRHLISTFYSEAFIIRSLGVPATKYFDFMDHVYEQPEIKELLETKDKIVILDFLITEANKFNKANAITKP